MEETIEEGEDEVEPVAQFTYRKKMARRNNPKKKCISPGCTFFLREEFFSATSCDRVDKQWCITATMQSFLSILPERKKHFPENRV
eukprot:snap_masked-scaffold_1-processed-gene-4.36-mRNA-1 protein AED:0.42 eAED:1.00 QI:0/-1/0/1/-1/1/1/0/85